VDAFYDPFKWRAVRESLCRGRYDDHPFPHGASFSPIILVSTNRLAYAAAIAGSGRQFGAKQVSGRSEGKGGLGASTFVTSQVRAERWRYSCHIHSNKSRDT